MTRTRRTAAAAAMIAAALAPVPAAAFGPEALGDLKLGLTLADMEQVGLDSLGSSGEADRNAGGDPELSFPTACSDKGRICSSADVDFTATALGEEAYLLTIRTRFATPTSLSRVLDPVKRQYGRETKRQALPAAAEKGKGSRQVVRLLWGRVPEGSGQLETYSGKIDLLSKGTARTAALMLLDVADGKVLSYTLMVMDRERYEKNRAFHQASASAPPARAQTVSAPATAGPVMP
ncbi:hypothetical protein [Prosthecomicrobium sp. N25]|uniref:hypothetical protein n=1 Tax=Prosthecomicrobium sp. N25 TaxID=3129254 RepID=UPI0030772B08